MKSVLISIQPKWYELIASGKKTVEVRKTKPKLETPFKVYIYCTKDEPLYRSGEKFWCKTAGEFGNGKVIGAFVCDKIYEGILRKTEFIDSVNIGYDKTCVPIDELAKYLDAYGICGEFNFYGWHISDLVIYDKPRELAEFKRVCDGNCQGCKYAIWESQGWYHELKIVDCKRITAPQSWCYVYEAKNETN